MGKPSERGTLQLISAPGIDCPLLTGAEENLSYRLNPVGSSLTLDGRPAVGLDLPDREKLGRSAN
jgi:hypothetical protein